VHASSDHCGVAWIVHACVSAMLMMLIHHLLLILRCDSL